MRIGTVAVAFALVAATGTADMALARSGSAFAAISAEDWRTAERELLAELRIHPRRPELMLNLAAVYARTGRESQARALYAAVLDRPATAMDMPSGDVRSSHALAQTGLSRLAVTMTASR